MKKLALSLCLALLAVPLAPVPATAQEADADREPTEDPVGHASDTVFVQESLPFVPASNTITAKLPIATEWTPANVGVVDLTAITEQDAIVLGDALHNVSGLNVQTGNGVFDFFVVRGFDSISSGLILTDGAPEPETTFYQLYNTEQVEVFKGPAGFLYGSNPLAGVVNLVRKQPAPAHFGTVGLAAGSHDTLEATVDWNHGRPEGTVDFRLNALYRESDGYRDGRLSDTSAINPALTWRPDESTSINFNFESVTSDFTPDAGLPIVGGAVAEVPRDRSYASPLDFSQQDILRFQIDYEKQLSDRLAIRNKTYRRELDWRTNGTLLNGAARFRPDDLDVFRTLVLLDDLQELTGNQFEVTATLGGDSIEHNLLAGVEVSRLSDEFGLDVAFLPTIGLFQPFETTTEPLFFIPGQSARGDSRADVVAPYVIDQITFSEKVRLLLGARFDSIDFDDAVTGTRRSDSELSPLFGLVVAPTPSVSLYANAGESFSPPSARVVGERRPEESRQLELGIRKAFAGGRSTATFAVYQIDRDNIPIPDETGFTQQAGDQRSRGFESEVHCDFGSGLRGTLAYAYTDSELTRFREIVFFPPPLVGFQVLDHSGNASPFAPEHVLNTWLSKRFGERWTVAGGARFVDDQFIAEDNAFAIDNYVLLDAAASLTLGDWRINLNVKNLTDEDYDTRGFGSFSVIPGQPLSVFLALDYRL